jgi:hypothetical protein
MNKYSTNMKNLRFTSLTQVVKVGKNVFFIEKYAASIRKIVVMGSMKESHTTPDCINSCMMNYFN